MARIPLIELARNPVYDPEVTDGSVNHDKYIYTGNSPSPQPSPIEGEGE